ncbi:unnamed protein product [Cuscuta campestris]|uniref:Uncharacterized protein n=1 Tax=Cuscuta campestris TaxID=132261 RepID=A0A484L047_9ASTE|nr:unnamed protein product [Cuscuta campestris]
MRAFLKSLGGGVSRSVETGWSEPRKYSDDLTTSKVKPFEEYSRSETVVAEYNDKALNTIFGEVDSTQYKLISNWNSAKEAWDILEVTHEGDEEVKTAKYQILMTQYENLRMDDKEKITELDMTEDNKRRKLEKQVAFIGTETEDDFEHDPTFDEEFQEQLSLFTKKFKKQWVQKRGGQRQEGISKGPYVRDSRFREPRAAENRDNQRKKGPLCFECGGYVNMEDEESSAQELEELQKKWAQLVVINERNVEEKSQLTSEIETLRRMIEKSKLIVQRLEGEKSDLIFELNKLKYYQKWMIIAGAKPLDHHSVMSKTLDDKTCIGYTKKGDHIKRDKIKFVKETEESKVETTAPHSSDHHSDTKMVRMKITIPKNWMGRKALKKQLWAKHGWTRLLASRNSTKSDGEIKSHDMNIQEEAARMSSTNERSEEAVVQEDLKDDVMMQPSIKILEVLCLKYMPNSQDQAHNKEEKGKEIPEEEAPEVLEEEPLVACSAVPFKGTQSIQQNVTKKSPMIYGVRWSLRSSKSKMESDDLSRDTQTNAPKDTPSPSSQRGSQKRKGKTTPGEEESSKQIKKTKMEEIDQHKITLNKARAGKQKLLEVLSLLKGKQHAETGANTQGEKTLGTEGSTSQGEQDTEEDQDAGSFVVFKQQKSAQHPPQSSKFGPASRSTGHNAAAKKR